MTERRFELVHIEGTHTRLTITNERITLKIGTDAHGTAEELVAKAKRIAEQIPIETQSLRASYSLGGGIALRSGHNNRKVWGRFDKDGEKVLGV